MSHHSKMIRSNSVRDNKCLKLTDQATSLCCPQVETATAHSGTVEIQPAWSPTVLTRTKEPMRLSYRPNLEQTSINLRKIVSLWSHLQKVNNKVRCFSCSSPGFYRLESGNFFSDDRRNFYPPSVLHSQIIGPIVRDARKPLARALLR